jgi:hypothetical protein
MMILAASLFMTSSDFIADGPATPAAANLFHIGLSWRDVHCSKSLD